MTDGWDQLSKRRPLRTIREAALYIGGLPKKERQADYWQPAAVLLRLIGENGGCVFFARLAVMHGQRKGTKLDRPEPRRRRAKQYRIVR